MSEEIIGQLKPDEKGYITFQKIVDCVGLSKPELYKRALDFITGSYSDVNSIIQDRDIINGIIVAKGVFKNVQEQNDPMLGTIIDTWHILRTEVKDEKARIVLSLTHYEEILKGGMPPDFHYLYPLTEQFPFNPNGYQKALYEQALHKSHLRALETINFLERALKEGDVSKKDDW